MKKKSKLKFTLTKVVLTVLFLIPIALTLFVHVKFSWEELPKMGGFYIYLFKDEDNMWATVPSGAAGLFRVNDGVRHYPVSKGDLVLCRLPDDPDTVTLRHVQEVERSGDKGLSITVTDDSWEQEGTAISRESVVSSAEYIMTSKGVGAAIRFMCSLKGKLIIIGICLLLIAAVVTQKYTEPEAESGK